MVTLKEDVILESYKPKVILKVSVKSSPIAKFSYLGLYILFFLQNNIYCHIDKDQ